MLQHAGVSLERISPAPQPDARAEYLVQYEFAHEQLLKALAENAAVTQKTTPDRVRIAASRWRISKASRARLELWEKVRRALVSPSGGTDELLLRLSVENDELREAFSGMVTQWSSEAIEADWPGYCEAAQQIRWRQMSIIRHERRNLLPILLRLSGSWAALPSSGTEC